MIMQVFIVVIQALCYLPFFKMLDNKAAEEEKDEANA